MPDQPSLPPFAGMTPALPRDLSFARGPLTIDPFAFPPRPTADRPLLGQTILVVEDSRHAGETMRLICQRGGARMRRADSLRAAARHLTTYRPSVVVVDAGLPDGSGLDLIAQLAAATPRVPVLLAISGDLDQQDAALAAGADGFLAKPFASVALFQQAILARLPDTTRILGLRAMSDDHVAPDAASLHDDLDFVTRLLTDDPDGPTRDYALRFTIGLALTSDDSVLEAAARGALNRGEIDALLMTLHARMAAPGVLAI